MWIKTGYSQHWTGYIGLTSKSRSEQLSSKINAYARVERGCPKQLRGHGTGPLEIFRRPFGPVRNTVISRGQEI